MESDEATDRGDLVFCTLLIAFVSLLMYQALDLGPSARLVPLLFGIPTLAALLYQWGALVWQITVVDRQASEIPREGTSMKPGMRRKVMLVMWTLGLVALGGLVGLQWAVPVALFVFFRVMNRDGWKSSLALTAGSCLALYILFIILLDVSF